MFNRNKDIRISALNPHIRILITTGLYPPEVGGPATYTALLEKELPKRGFIVSVLPFRKVRWLPPILRHAAYFTVCLIGALKNDLIYAQDPVSVGLPSLLATKLAGRKFWIRVAGDYAWEQSTQRFGVKDGIDTFQNKKYDWRTELLRKIQNWVVGKADTIITPSKYFQKLVSGWIRNPEKVKVIYNGIELNQDADMRIKCESANCGYDKSFASSAYNPHHRHYNKTILSAGRLVPWKGFDVLVDIMKELPEWKLIIVGDGPNRENLESRIQKLGLGNRVKLTGAVSRGELLDLLNEASIFVLNTSFESFSFQVVEAMDAGVPVITTKIGNLEEVIKTEKEGILVEPNNKEEILAAIEKVSKNQKFREMIVKNAHQKAREFSIDKTVDNLVKLLNESPS